MMLISTGPPGEPCQLYAEIVADDTYSANLQVRIDGFRMICNQAHLPQLVHIDAASQVHLQGRPTGFLASPTESVLVISTDTQKLLTVTFNTTKTKSPKKGKDKPNIRAKKTRDAAKDTQHQPPLVPEIPSATITVVDICRHDLGKLIRCSSPLLSDSFSFKTKIGFSNLTFSPDGQWLAYVCPTSENTSFIRMRHWRSKEPSINVTSGLFQDSFPCFSRMGNYLYFLSCREFEPVVDALQVGVVLRLD